MRKIFKIIYVLSILPIVLLFLQFWFLDPVPRISEYIDNLYLQAIILGFLFDLFILIIVGLKYIILDE